MELYERWFAYWLQDGDRAVVDGPPVRIFVMGDNAWRDEQEWPLASARSTAYYLHSGGRANTLDGDGLLTLTAPRASRATTSPTTRGIRSTRARSAAYSKTPSDQRSTQRRRDVLVYSTPPLAQPTWRSPVH